MVNLCNPCSAVPAPEPGEADVTCSTLGCVNYIVVSPFAKRPTIVILARCESCGAQLTSMPRYFKQGEPVCSQACAVADPMLITWPKVVTV